MLKMNEYEYIRILHFNRGKNIKEIHELTSKDPKTIRKALKGVTPKYRKTKERAKPVIGEYIQIIEQWLKEDKKAPKKQRHTGRRIYHRLKEEHGYKGSERTVQREVSRIKSELGLLKKEEFIPSDPEKREGAEVDWGEAYVELDGQRKKLQLFCMRSKKSGKFFVRAYETANQECFFNGHIQAFAYFGGVHSKIIYDNLKSAVLKILKGSNRVEQESFRLFRAYYNFEGLFCNAAKGNEKGGVEGIVGYARRNFMTPIPKIENIEQLNEHLLKKINEHDNHTIHGKKETIGEAFLKEEKELIKLPPKVYQNYKIYHSAKVDKFMTVRILSNRYSVPSGYTKRKVSVELGLSDVRIVYQNKLLASHKRVFGKNEWVLDPWHYLPVLKKKPRAFDSSKILSIMEENWNPVILDLWLRQKEVYGSEEGTKEFLSTLLLFDENKYQDMVALLEIASEQGICSKEMITSLASTLTEKTLPISELKIGDLPEKAEFEIPSPDIDKFDLLLQESCHES